MPTALTREQIHDALRDLRGWAHENDALSKTFRFSGFKEALSFIVRIGMHAEEQQHHPEIHNVYATVTLTLRTHDAGDKVTEKDLTLARTVEEVNWLPK